MHSTEVNKFRGASILPFQKCGSIDSHYDEDLSLHIFMGIE